MSRPLSDAEARIKTRLVEGFSEYAAAVRDLARDGVDRAAVLREMLRGEDRVTALAVLPHLAERDVLSVFDDLVFLASFSHGSIETVRSLILRLPRDEVLARVSTAAERYLRDGTDEEFRRFLELYDRLDPELARQLASTAAAHGDPDVREAGHDYLVRTGRGSGLGFPAEGERVSALSAGVTEGLERPSDASA